MHKKKSFTLIELLVVIVIIGILAGVIMISTSSSIDKANFAKAQAFSSTVQNELLSNLVSEWTFDNASNIGEDTWGNNHGTLYGSAGSQNLPQLQSTSECVFGTCLKFDGYDDYFRITSFNGLAQQSQATISFWTNDDVNTGVKHILWADRNVLMEYNNSNLRVRWNLEGDWRNNHTAVGVLKKNIWIFHTITFYNGITKIYTSGIETLNNGLDTQTLINNYVPNYDFALRDAQHFKGKLDDVRIYNAALSYSQIKQNYITGLNSLFAGGNISKKEYNERINELAYEK